MTKIVNTGVPIKYL